MFLDVCKYDRAVYTVTLAFNNIRISCVYHGVGQQSGSNTRTLHVYAYVYMNEVDVIDRMNCTGQAMEIKRFGVRELLPDTKHYMTYDGSTTMPACHETTTWIILNKPIYITKQQASIAAAGYYKMHAHASALERSRARRDVRRPHSIMQFRSLKGTESSNIEKRRPFREKLK